MIFPSRKQRAVRLKRLAAIFAAMLLAGIFVSCHSALRTSQWMIQATSTDPLQIKNGEGAAKWFVTVTSLEREDWFANVLTAIGLGAMSGALFVLAVTSRWQFSLRTLIAATIYFAVIIGVPFGLVRPRLQNPRISVHPASLMIVLGQIRPYPGSKGQNDPWISQGSVSRGGSTLVSSISVALAFVALVIAPAIAHMPSFQTVRSNQSANHIC